MDCYGIILLFVFDAAGWEASSLYNTLSTISESLFSGMSFNLVLE